MSYKKQLLLLCALTVFTLSYGKEPIKKTSIQTKGKLMLKNNELLNLSEFKKLEKVNSPLLYKITQTGNGPKPCAGETVTVHYTGHLLHGDKIGTKFDSSVDRGDKFKFPLGMGYVIKGWDQAVADMRIGEKRIVILPASIAYGSRGAGASIPPNATLVFEIELFDAK